MIDKREILAAAEQTSLTPHVVEKDYVLGWMLAGIYQHEDLAENWIFKGGTCLKKCFFETYRFSEDLDFTLLTPEHIDADFLQDTFGEIGDWIHEQTGIEFPADRQEFDVYQNPRGQLSCQGKISYKGPVSPTHGLPRIKLDLTADERIVRPAAQLSGGQHSWGQNDPDAVLAALSDRTFAHRDPKHSPDIEICRSRGLRRATRSCHSAFGLSPISASGRIHKRWRPNLRLQVPGMRKDLQQEES